MNSEELIRTANLQKISEEGQKIYDQEKSKYEPAQNGKFLAIEIESGDVYLANSSSEAVDLARKVHPEKVFYVVKIGHSSAETLASLGGE
ncbi:MAG: hypothetical protein AAB562_01170 [Patescibacteria group bacterium]